MTVTLLSMLCVSVYADDAEEFQRIIQLGDRTAVTYSYTNDAYKKLTTVTYANGDYIEYEYDTSGRVHRQVYDDGDIVTFEYNDQSEFSCITDTGSGLATEFYFDSSNHLIEYGESGTGFTHTACYTYDESERISSYTDQIGNQAYTVDYTYDTNGRLIAVDYVNSCKEYSYDSSNRIIQMVTSYNDTVVLTESLTYYDETTEFAGKLASHTYTWRTREIVLM